MDKRKKKILVVDNDKDLCDLISDIMEEDGYSVKKVYDGNSALDEILADKYDVMIIDNKLSGISGINVIERSKYLNPSIRTIMISAYGNTNTKLRARDLGVYDFLDKPFDIKKLLSRVGEVIFNPKVAGMSLIY
jgi:two-component system nitrogen regulation response regulator NtrX